MNAKTYSRESLAVTQQKIVAMIKPGSRVLEMGSATGFMTRYLSQELSCAVTAIEIDPVQAEQARPFADEMIVGSLDDPGTWESLRPNSFDHVIFADVLEHLVDPWLALRRCHSLLAEGGSLLASLPNIAFIEVRLALLRGRFEYTDFGILDDTHLRFFTAESTRRLFESTGYRVDEFIRTFREDRYLRLSKVFPTLFTYQFVVKATPVPPNQP